MNKLVLAPLEPVRHRFTSEDVFRMQETGILPPDHRCELIHGELIEMPHEGDLHSFLKSRLLYWFNRHLNPELHWVGADTTLFLDEDAAPEPDLFVSVAGTRPSQERGETVLLVVEVADSSLDYDLTAKADLYRSYGVREYWVIDVNVRVTHIHLLQDDGQWPRPEPAPFEAELAPGLLAGVRLRLSDLE